MRFALSDEQRQFASSIDDLLSNTDVIAACGAWEDGEHDFGLRVWQRLAELGVTALVIPEEYGGIGADAVDLVVAFERLGYHAVPGPWVESAAVAPTLLQDSALAEQWLPAVAKGEALASFVLRPQVPFALDADIADLRVVIGDAELRRFVPTARHSSVDGTRRLFDVANEEQLASINATTQAFDAGALATAAQLIGAGGRLLDASVSYAKQRHQYGHPIGQYQAIKHLLADVATKLELARPLLYSAAIAFDQRTDTFVRDVSAAKAAAADAAYLAARTGLQVHGAIGYTSEYTLGLWLTKARALVSAWGTSAFHRGRVLDAITRERRAR